MKTTLIGLALFPLLASCSTPPAAQAPAPRDFPVGASTEAAWAALVEVYTDLNIPIANMDKSSGFLRSGDFGINGKVNGRPASEYFDCGREAGSARADMFRITAQFTTLIREQQGQAAVRTQANAQDHQNRECVSTGAFEEMIAEAIAARAGND